MRDKIFCMATPILEGNDGLYIKSEIPAMPACFSKEDPAAAAAKVH